MATKLTLSLKQDVILKAKQYATQHKTSLSVLVENYFRFLTEKNKPENKTISPLVEELSGIINLPDKFDQKEEYTNYLIEKYK